MSSHQSKNPTVYNFTNKGSGSECEENVNAEDNDVDEGNVEDIRSLIRTTSEHSYAQVYPDYTPYELWDDNLTGYYVHNILGSGSFGSVFCAKNKKENKSCAIKLVRTTKSHLDLISREVEILSSLKHPNICGLLCACVTDDGVLVLVMPFMVTIRQIIVERLSRRGYYDEPDLGYQAAPLFSEPAYRTLATQLCSGLAFMHTKGYIHRDLKSENLLFSPNGQLQVADFGLSRSFDLTKNDGMGLMDTPCGTKMFLAPEVAENYKRCANARIYEQSPVFQKYDIRSETWSAGICVLEIIFGINPFAGQKNLVEYLTTLQEKIGNENLTCPWKEMYPLGNDMKMDLSRHGREFIGQCFIVNGKHRPTLQKLLKHSTFLIQPQLQKDELVEEVLGDEIADAILEDIEHNTAKALKSHKKRNNDPKPTGNSALGKNLMCLSLETKKHGRMFKKIAFFNRMSERDVEKHMQLQLYGYLHEQVIDLYDFLAINTQMLRCFRQNKKGIESPAHINLNNGGICVLSWWELMFYDEENPRPQEYNRPVVKPRAKPRSVKPTPKPRRVHKSKSPRKTRDA